MCVVVERELLTCFAVRTRIVCRHAFLCLLNLLLSPLFRQEASECLRPVASRIMV
jgi:hypothetical protein